MSKNILWGGVNNPVNSRTYNLKPFLVSLIFSIFIFNNNAYSQSSESRAELRAKCDEVKRQLNSNENCANMTNDDIKAFIQSVESKMKKKEEIAVLISLKKAYNKEVTIDNYGDICEQMKKVFPDNKVCKEKLPAECYNSNLETVLYPAVTTCYDALVGAPSSNSGCQHDNIPLLKAVCEQNSAKIKEVLNRKSEDVNVTNSVGENALHLAVKKNDSAIFNLLVNSNIDANKKDNNGNTPLHTAAKNNNYDMVLKLAVDKRADVYAVNKDGKMPIELTTNNSIRTLLEDVMANNDSDKFEEFRRNRE